MKQLILSSFLLILVSTMFAQNKLPDDGISSETHKKNIGKTLFSKTEVLFKKENLNTWTTNFNWGDPIYARMYWAEGLNNIYLKNGWSKPMDTYRYVLRFYFNGKYVAEKIVQSSGERTSLPLCLYPAKSDSYDWSEMHILANNLGKFKNGSNKVKVEVCAYVRSKNLRSEPISSGEFYLNVAQKLIEESNQLSFKGIKSKWGKWDEWIIYTSNSDGALKSKWGGKDEWTYNAGEISGSIKATWGKFDEWDLKTASNTVKLKTKWDKMDEWVISDKNSTLNMKTKWGKYDEWDVSGKKGTMYVKVKWSGDNGWLEWKVEDNMKAEKPELKMAALFIAIFQGIPK